jgi:hypothetical protein
VTKIQTSGYLILCALLLNPLVGLAQEATRDVKIDQTRGVDQRVDYSSLVKFGPWDDRNYKLTMEDLSYLSPDEENLKDPIPAFFRVELRKEMPELRKNGPAQYPRSAVQLFQRRYGGLLPEPKTMRPEKTE